MEIPECDSEDSDKDEVMSHEQYEQLVDQPHN